MAGWIACRSAVAIAGLSALFAAGLGITECGAQDADRLRAEIRKLDAARRYSDALAPQRDLARHVARAPSARQQNSDHVTAATLGSFAWYALIRGSYKDALDASEQALALAPDLHWIDANRAHALFLLGNRAKALKIYRSHVGERLYARSDKLWEDVIKEDIEALQWTGLSADRFADVLEAIGIANAAADDSITSARIELDQANAAGRGKELLSLAEKFVALNAQRYGEGRSEYADALTWLATAKAKLDQTDDAEELYGKVIDIRERALGPDHPDVANDLIRLGDLLSGSQRVKEAEALYQRALIICHQNFGQHHIATADALDSLSGYYVAQKRWTDAEPLLEQELAVREVISGADAADVAQTLKKLANLYAAQGRSADADRATKRMRDIAQGKL